MIDSPAATDVTAADAALTADEFLELDEFAQYDASFVCECGKVVSGKVAEFLSNEFDQVVGVCCIACASR